MLKLPNKVEKLKVDAFKKPSRNGPAESFDFLINPDTINSKHENKFSRARGINTSGRSASYVLSNSDQMRMQLTLDHTIMRQFLLGKAFSSSSESIKKKVEKFLKYCFYMDGDIHEPRFLIIEWGDFSFECRLKSVEVSYSHFNAKGEAMRAKLDTIFVADMPAAKRIRLENKKSPDITHSKTVLEGQTLTGLTKEVYGDASHYLMVAEANQLNHFRKLKPGMQLRFPPLEK